MNPKSEIPVCGRQEFRNKLKNQDKKFGILLLSAERVEQKIDLRR
jgi:hypothetical protein